MAPVPPILEPRSDIHVLAERSPPRQPEINHSQGTSPSTADSAFTDPVNWNAIIDGCVGRSASGIAALTPSTGSVASELDLREERAEKLLSLYRDQFEIHIPVQFVSPEETAQELYSTRPWVFRTVMMLACQDARKRQLDQSVQLVRDFADAMLVRGEKSLDMLQALLIYNSWYTSTFLRLIVVMCWANFLRAIYVTPQTPQTASAGVMQLAVAMLVDLGLNRPARQDDGAAEIERWALNEQSANDVKRTIAERRAYLYCYLLTST